MAINVNSLIAAASKKLGVPEEKLRKAVNEGNVSELRSYLNSSERETLDRAMKDKGLTDSLKNKYMPGK